MTPLSYKLRFAEKGIGIGVSHVLYQASNKSKHKTKKVQRNKYPLLTKFKIKGKYIYDFIIRIWIMRQELKLFKKIKMFTLTLTQPCPNLNLKLKLPTDILIMLKSKSLTIKQN